MSDPDDLSHRRGPSHLTDDERRVLDAVDEQATLDLLVDLVKVPSATGSAAESELQHRLAPRLEQLGLDVDLWQLDLAGLRSREGFPGTEAPREEAWGLVGTQPGELDAPTLILQGHVDVVPPGDRMAWSRDPFDAQVAGGQVHGRGACDMKAGVAATLAAVQALRAAGTSLPGGLAVHLVVGEEDGGLGAFGTLARGHTGGACVIPEPTSGTLVTANAGALTFRLTVPGLATHGSTRYAGVSAIDNYLAVHEALKALEARRNRRPDPLMSEYAIAYPLSVGTVHAGDWASTVPDRLVAEGRLGVRLDEDPIAARTALEDMVAEVCAGHPWMRDRPVTVEWSGGQFASGRLPDGHPLAEVVTQAHADVTGRIPRRRGAPYGSDLRLYAAEGIPTLHFGPGDVRLAHAADERVPIAELHDVARTLALTALRTCGPAAVERAHNVDHAHKVERAHNRVAAPSRGGS